jgi:hypothetical protein
MPEWRLDRLGLTIITAERAETQGKACAPGPWTSCNAHKAKDMLAKPAQMAFAARETSTSVMLRHAICPLFATQTRRDQAGI